MLWRKSIFQLPYPSPPISIIPSFPIFISLQSNWRAPYSLSYSVESQMLYEDSSVLPSTNLELFRTALLNYRSEFFCWYIVVVKVKGTEAILSARMTNFTISLFHHCNIAPFWHFTISPLHHYNITPFHHYTVSPFHHFIVFGSYTSSEHKSSCPYLHHLKKPLATFHTSDPLVPYRKKNICFFPR